MTTNNIAALVGVSHSFSSFKNIMAEIKEASSVGLDGNVGASVGKDGVNLVGLAVCGSNIQNKFMYSEELFKKINEPENDFFKSLENIASSCSEIFIPKKFSF